MGNWLLPPSKVHGGSCHRGAINSDHRCYRATLRTTTTTYDLCQQGIHFRYSTRLRYTPPLPGRHPFWVTRRAWFLGVRMGVEISKNRSSRQFWAGSRCCKGQAWAIPIHVHRAVKSCQPVNLNYLFMTAHAVSGYSSSTIKLRCHRARAPEDLYYQDSF